MPSFGLCGPSYQSRSIAVDGEQCINLFPEVSAPGLGNRWVLYKVPGKLLFGTLGPGPVNCIVPSNQQFNGFSGAAGAVPAYFALSGGVLYAVYIAYNSALTAPACFSGVGTAIASGFAQQPVASGQLFPAQIIVMRPDLLFIVSGGFAYVVSYGTQFIVCALNSGGQSYAVGDTGIFVGSNGASAMYQVTGVTTTPAGQIINNPLFANLGGAGYVTGDTGTVTGAGGSGATYVVDSVVGGAVLGFHITASGTGYSAQTNVATTATTGAGSGFTFDILAVSTAPTGTVTSFTLLSDGTGYVVAAGVQTQNAGAQPGVGEGFTVNITAVGPLSWRAFPQTIPNAG